MIYSSNNDIAMSSEEDVFNEKRHFSQGDVIRYKKEKRKLKNEKLIRSLEKKKKTELIEIQYEEQKKVAQELEDQEPSPEGRSYTVSLALAGSILDNAQSPELRTYLAGQIARALAIFNIDEVVVFDDVRKIGIRKESKTTEGEYAGVKKHGEGCLQLARILQFLECPQYLRKHFFPLHKDLQYAGVLNPTDMPHHLRANEFCYYREGVVLDRPPCKHGSMVNIGLSRECCINKSLTPGVRVTVKLQKESEPGGKMIRTEVVPPGEPREKKGLFWGYSVRLADSLTAVFSQSPYKGGYDLTIGTSERGDEVDDCQIPPKFKHLLVVFGGLKGLEIALESDEKLSEVEDPADLFDLYLNTCPNQGSRTIRTEEAILISLAALRPKIILSQNPK